MKFLIIILVVMLAIDDYGIYCKTDDLLLDLTDDK